MRRYSIFIQFIAAMASAGMAYADNDVRPGSYWYPSMLEHARLYHQGTISQNIKLLQIAGFALTHPQIPRRFDDNPYVYVPFNPESGDQPHPGTVTVLHFNKKDEIDERYTFDRDAQTGKPRLLSASFQRNKKGQADRWRIYGSVTSPIQPDFLDTDYHEEQRDKFALHRSPQGEISVAGVKRVRENLYVAGIVDKGDGNFHIDFQYPQNDPHAAMNTYRVVTNLNDRALYVKQGVVGTLWRILGRETHPMNRALKAAVKQHKQALRP